MDSTSFPIRRVEVSISGINLPNFVSNPLHEWGPHWLVSYQLAADPASQANNVKTLQGRDGIRLRVGDWRVIKRDGEVLAVLEIGPRGCVSQA